MHIWQYDDNFLCFAEIASILLKLTIPTVRYFQKLYVGTRILNIATDTLTEKGRKYQEL